MNTPHGVMESIVALGCSNHAPKRICHPSTIPTGAFSAG